MSKLASSTSLVQRHDRIFARVSYNIRQSSLSTFSEKSRSIVVPPAALGRAIGISSKSVEFTTEYLHEEGIELCQHHHVAGAIYRTKDDIEVGENHHVGGRMIRQKEAPPSSSQSIMASFDKAARAISTGSKPKPTDATSSKSKHSYLLSLFETVQVIPKKSKHMEDLERQDGIVYSDDVASAHTQGGMYLRQVNSEERQHNDALKDYLETVKLLVNRSRGTSLGFVQRVLLSWCGPFKASIAKELNDITAGKPGVDRRVRKYDTICIFFVY